MYLLIRNGPKMMVKMSNCWTDRTTLRLLGDEGGTFGAQVISDIYNMSSDICTFI